MKILIDIGHPAHVHYFKNFISIMTNRGHDFCVTARNKEVVFKLLEHYNINYITRGTGGKGLFKKLIYILKADFIIFKSAKHFKPDLFLSFGSPYAAHVAWLTRKPHIAFDDTDHAPFEHALYVPFTKCIITPIGYLKDFKKKHIRLNSYMELCSTHAHFFKPDISSLKKLELNENEKYVIIRLVSWNASHDINLKGISNDNLLKLIGILEKKFRIIITSESKLSPQLTKYQFNLSPELMHQALYFADLFIGESLTMSIEAITLGTPAFAITNAIAGVTNEQIKDGVLKKFENAEELIEEVKKTIEIADYKLNFKKKISPIISSKTNITDFMVWFVEKFPESFIKMKANPNFELEFVN